MIENDLDAISEKIQAITPASWSIDISQDARYLLISRKDEKNMRQSDILFFEDAAKDVAKLVYEIRRLKEINVALKRQIVKDLENKNNIEKDLRFLQDRCMQTFLPHSNFYDTAAVLDWRRLGKQRVEAKQILLTIDRGDEAKGWKNHPAVNMWRGYEPALAMYGAAICSEWIRRGYNDTQLAWFLERMPANEYIVLPPWLGDERLHISHQSNLIRKDPDYYSPLFEGVSADVPYYWPDPRTDRVLQTI